MKAKIVKPASQAMPLMLSYEQNTLIGEALLSHLANLQNRAAEAGATQEVEEIVAMSRAHSYRLAHPPYQIWQDWYKGESDQMAEEVLAKLADHYEWLESSLETLGEQRESLRSLLASVVGEMGGEAKTHQYNLRITYDTHQTRYDREALNDLAERLRQMGQVKLAESIEACRKETKVKGGLRVDPRRTRPQLDDLE